MPRQLAHAKIPMKKCSYCGAEYSDDAIVCSIDQTRFDTAYQPTVEAAAGTSAAKRDIPIALSVVSYLLFFTGAWLLVWNAFIVFYLGGTVQFDLIGGILVIIISRGLRKCSRACRTCALIIIWAGVISLAVIAYDLFAPYFQPTIHKPLPMDRLVTLAVCFLIQIYQYQVLTRPDVRELFYEKP